MVWIQLARDMVEVGFCKCGNEISSSINVGEFLDLLSYYQLLKKDSGLCT
jgi:hypothetical protein